MYHWPIFFEWQYPMHQLCGRSLFVLYQRDKLYFMLYWEIPSLNWVNYLQQLLYGQIFLNLW